MALKTGIFSLALGTLLLGTSALADDTQKFQPQHDASQVQAQGFRGGPDHSPSWGNPPAQNPSRDGRWYRRTPQPAPRNDNGRYELKLVQQWVPGSYDRVWVPESCSYRPRHGRSQCTGGYYTQQWVEGHYETVEQWVWVANPWRRGSPVVYWHN
ncbi:hypothetical protein [Hyalangium versicolor]|uniref:hypothetical protein n=1 Tax=Hyalangium versicolor TaxID=2861190 RepID=UPI001CCFB27E|nr:hypothetical protein [Hyalangium versicolor]